VNTKFTKADRLTGRDNPDVGVYQEILADVQGVELWPWLNSELERLLAFDRYTCIHSIRVAEIARLLASELGCKQEDIRNIVLGAVLHDLGKLKIPAAVLNKPGKLSAEEMEIIKQHPVLGEEMLQVKQLPLVVRLIIYQHHERWDGRGYPDVLQGLQIHQFAQIVAVADIFDALTAVRPYRAELPRQIACEMVLAGAGTDFDEEVVEAFRRVFDPRQNSGAFSLTK